MRNLILIDYTNWKGQRSIRTISPPFTFYFGSTEYHPVQQPLLKAIDVDKKAYRTFAMKDIHNWFFNQEIEWTELNQLYLEV